MHCSRSNINTRRDIVLDNCSRKATRLLLLLSLLLLPIFSHAQADLVDIEHFRYGDKDLSAAIDTTWLFINADDTAMAYPAYNDSSWAQVRTELKGDSNMSLLNGVGWFRKRLYIDDSVAGKTYALTFEHFGASEIYLDGVLLKKYGKIGIDEAGTEYSNPAMEPCIFYFPDTGMHTLAIRYANYRSEPQRDNKEYFHGFSVKIAEANSYILSYSMLRMVVFGIIVGLACIFITLSGLHLLLWMFRISDRSNLYLSILCGAFCIFFFMMSFWTQTSDVDVDAQQKSGTAILLSFVLISLSALLNELFGSLRWRFFTIVVLVVVSAVLTLSRYRYEEAIASLVMLIVMAEACVLIISAIRQKIKGAKILAIGILPLAFSILIIYGIRLFLTNDLDNLNAQDLDGVAMVFVMLFSIIMVIALSGIPFSMSIFLAWRFATVNRDLGKQLKQVQDLSEQTRKQEAEKKRILENQKEELEKEVAERTREIVDEKKKSDDLLHNILPEEVADELKERGATTAHQFDHVTVLFTDFVNFTKAGERMSSQELVEELHNCFKAFDEIMSRYGIEKIKTIGDAYLAVCGLPTVDERHAEKVVNAANDILKFMLQRRTQLGDKTFEIRIGIHSGEVVAGIVGVKKFAYDIWGDTVNTAARMESKSEPGKINISQTTYELVQDKFTCTYRGELEAKNKGKLKMYFVEA